jgi:hypothetical protein
MQIRLPACEISSDAASGSSRRRIHFAALVADECPAPTPWGPDRTVTVIIAIADEEWAADEGEPIPEEPVVSEGEPIPEEPVVSEGKPIPEEPVVSEGKPIPESEPTAAKGAASNEASAVTESGSAKAMPAESAM